MTTLLNGIQVSDKQIEELLGRLLDVVTDSAMEFVRLSTIAEAAEATRQAERDTVRRWLAALTVEAVDDSDDDLSGEPAGSCDDCGINIYGDDNETIDGDEYLCDQCYWARSAEQSS